jgi:hypothetical protein
VELEQCRRPDQRAKLRQPVRAHEQRGRAEDEAIDGSEIGRPLPGAIIDEQLVLEQQGLGGDGADATGAKELRECDDQVDDEDEEVAHGANRIMAARARKTAPYRRIPSYYDFATHRLHLDHSGVRSWIISRNISVEGPSGNQDLVSSSRVRGR